MEGNVGNMPVNPQMLQALMKGLAGGASKTGTPRDRYTAVLEALDSVSSALMSAESELMTTRSQALKLQDDFTQAKEALEQCRSQLEEQNKIQKDLEEKLEKYEINKAEVGIPDDTGNNGQVS